MRNRGKARTGCALPLVVFLVLFGVVFVVSRPAEIVDDFSGDTARRFSVAIVVETGEGTGYQRRTLQSIAAPDEERPAFDFLLREPRVRISGADRHTAEIVEDHGDWQLVRFDYSNTYQATGLYRAWRNRVEPVSYQVTSGVGDAIVAVALVVPAWLIAALITFVRNRRRSPGNGPAS